MNVLLLGLVNWIATCVIVESELAREPREWIEGKANVAYAVLEATDGKAWRYRSWLWGKAAYLTHCHLCTGIWVGIVLAIIFGSPFGTGFAAIVAGGLAYKAIGHLALEVSAVLKGVANHG